MNRLYSDLATWWPLLSPPGEYTEEAVYYGDQLIRACDGEARTVLELGAGGGNNAYHMKSRFELTLVDLSPAMVELNKNCNPECRHLVGDMRTLRLDQVFDGVFVHDAASFLRSCEDLRAALTTAFVHLRPGGACLFAPDYTAESFHVSTSHGGVDGDDGRGLRYLEWTWDPDPDDGRYFVDFALALRDPGGTVTVEHDRHELGCLSRKLWLSTMGAAGMSAHAEPCSFSETMGFAGEVFVGRK